MLAPAAAAIIFDGQGHVLLAKHTEGGWGVVGGEASPDGIEVAALGYFAPEELTGDFLLKRWHRRVLDALGGAGPTYFEPPTWQPPGVGS